MSQHITNPLASPEQLASIQRPISHSDRELILFTTSRLTQYAAVLLQLPQSVGAQAVVLLHRYWVTEPMLAHDFSDTSAALLYTTAKISAHPRSMRSICAVYLYLSQHPSPSLPSPATASYFVPESHHSAFTTRILHLEGLVLAALSFNLHVSLPHPLVITYLQALDLFRPSSPSSSTPPPGPRIAALAIKHLNTALLSPQLLYLTSQPNVLAVCAVYLAARQEGVGLPEEWWGVWDVEREELGWGVVGMLSLEGWVGSVGEGKLGRMVGRGEFGKGQDEVDEMVEMGRALDRRET